MIRKGKCRNLEHNTKRWWNPADQAASVEGVNRRRIRSRLLQMPTDDDGLLFFYLGCSARRNPLLKQRHKVVARQHHWRTWIGNVSGWDSSPDPTSNMTYSMRLLEERVDSGLVLRPAGEQTDIQCLLDKEPLHCQTSGIHAVIRVGTSESWCAEMHRICLVFLPT